MLVQAKRLANDAPYAVSTHGAADGTQRHGHAEPGLATAVRNILDSEERVADATSGLAYLLEVPSVAELLGRRKTVACRGVRADQRDTPTASRLRPFALRRLMTWRPFLVAMRARKPWVRLRLILLGWYVRFMAATLNDQ